MAQRFLFRNRLQRDGTSQSQRRLAALDPSSAVFDARDVGDFLVFAQQFARHVIYRNLENTESGDWESFFGNDASAVIAAIEKTNPLPVGTAARNALEGPPTPENLQQVFTQLASLAGMLNKWREGVGTATDFRQQIDRRIRANLGTTWRRLVAYHRASAEQLPSISFDPAVYEGFAPIWWADAPESGGDPNSVPPDFGLFGDYESDDSRIQAALEQLGSLFVPLYGVLQKIITMAPDYFARDLDSRRNVEPHLALFISFLRLYLLLRDDANNLSQRHLEFFYEQVLGMQRRPADPDKVHVIVELARQVEREHRLAAGVKLDAGKDQIGVPLAYEVDEDLVASKAQIESFRTVFVDYERKTEGAAGQPGNRVAKRVHAAPVANSGDGMGAEIEDAERPSWPTLGANTIPEATLGFAFASRSLLLAEGRRKIELELEAAGIPADLPATLPKGAFITQLSGAKGWFQPDVTIVTVRGGKVTLDLGLKSTAEAVTFADEKTLGESFGTTNPVLKVILDQSKLGYGFLKDLRLQKVTLRTTASGLTNVIVQNDQFAMDAAKPFEPFGPSPAVGSNFYVGSAEAFEKNLTALTLNVTWDRLPESFKSHYEAYVLEKDLPAKNAFKATAEVLQDGNWVTLKKDVQLFDKISFSVTHLAQQEQRGTDELSEWTPATQHGFLRLVLTGPSKAFFHAEYVTVLMRQSIAASRLPHCTPGAIYRKDSEVVVCEPDSRLTGAVALLPNAPYTPTIKAFELSYKASTDSDTAPESLTFFHIEPFGYRKVSLPSTDSAPPLLPQFDDEGSLYLGLRDLVPQQSLSILFQVAEATADTNVRKPELQWCYLADNEWVKFKDFEITADTTRGLIASGVVVFSVPRGITAGNTRLPGQLLWLRAAVADRAAGVSDLINAHTQAVRATFVDAGNDPHHLDSPLSAGTVAGLVQDDAAVAGITQPYDGFGGRPVENSLAFYTRVAEHLRHKGRPITLFDYERLVLENFPKVYKAKCINHTSAQHAIAAGHVMVAVIPDFSQLKAVDRREPKVTLDDLDAIRKFLESINCPFVRNDRSDGRQRLHVLNPVYEYVHVAFKVRFRPNVTALAFYRRKLNEAINRFLSPWAFEDRAEIFFGGKVYKSSILNFVEEQPYVDFLTDFVMSHRVEEHSTASEDLDAIEATTPRSILIPAKVHDIADFTEAQCANVTAASTREAYQLDELKRQPEK